MRYADLVLSRGRTAELLREALSARGQDKMQLSELHGELLLDAKTPETLELEDMRRLSSIIVDRDIRALARDTVSLITAWCSAFDAPLGACGEELERFELAGIEAKAIARWRASMDEELEDKLAKIASLRSEDMGDVVSIEMATKLLEFSRRRDAAMRMLSEVVEFAPHDFARRRIYAEKLIARGEVLGGCAQLATAVQLAPSQRDVFLEMMKLRRSHDQLAKPIRQCVVDSVSSLPVQRAISLVLTWEDPSADVDMHIKETDGEHVSYTQRTSKKGGLLYHDVTDGFGPEIYVLGSGPAGDYGVELVYYSGSAKSVRGTLTILRRAGSPDETREDRPFVLTGVKQQQKKIAVFRLTDADDPKASKTIE